MRFNDRAMALAGIPDLPADAFKKEGGKNKLHGGGGGGQPSNTTNVTTSIPEYAKPYVEKMLGKAEASINQDYQPYGGQRVAQFNGLQNQAFNDARNLDNPGQIAAGTNLAGSAGIGALNAGNRYAMQATNPGVMGAYMSPYIQQALAPQMEELRRQSDITGQMNAGQAVKAGAFGGSRFGIQEAERQRNLGQLQAQTYGKGMEDAFRSAQQSMQFGNTLNMQGLQAANQAANTLGQLGQTDFNQDLQAMQARAGAGATIQGQEQKALDQQYQDFLNQRGYQQQQLGWFSDMLRGLPLTQQTTAMYQAPPSMLSQLAGAGTSLYAGTIVTGKQIGRAHV